MTRKDLPPVSYICNLVKYEPESGLLFWIKRHQDMFLGATQGPHQACRIWNGKWAGKPALNTFDTYGYKHGRIMGRNYKAHRVAYAIYTGSWPSHHIDHINGNRADNRACNLRDVSRCENQRNMCNLPSGKYGQVGVRYDHNINKWIAKIGVGGTSKHLGCFENIEDAISERVSAERVYGYSLTHGKRATEGE